VYPDDPQVLARATTAGQKRDLVALWADTDAMRRAAAKSEHSTLKGDPAVRRATSTFIDDLDRSSIDDLSKNRVIDHAAAAIATVCEQCFQQLEAMRPIPATFTDPSPRADGQAASRPPALRKTKVYRLTMVSPRGGLATASSFGSPRAAYGAAAAAATRG
jgi:hypothetical protein